MTGYDKPLPKLNSDTRPFWEECKKHELRLQQCLNCSHVRWPSSIICPKCHAREAEWIVASGHGSVYTYAIYHVAYHPGFSDDIPYVVAIVALDEGPHFLTNIINCRVDDVKCGMDVTVVWEDITPEVTLPKFRPL